MFSYGYDKAGEDLDDILGQFYSFQDNLTYVLCSLMDKTELGRAWTANSRAVLIFSR